MQSSQIKSSQVRPTHVTLCGVHKKGHRGLRPCMRKIDPFRKGSIFVSSLSLLPVATCPPPPSGSSFRLSCSRTWGATVCQRNMRRPRRQRNNILTVIRRLRLRIAPPRRRRPCGPRCLQATRPGPPPSAIMNVLNGPTMAFATTVGLVRLTLLATCAPLRLRPNSTPVCADQCGPNPRPSFSP